MTNDRLEQLRQMLEGDPTDAFCLYALGMEYASRSEHEAAAAHLEQSLATDPDQPYAHFHRARSLMAMGLINEAAVAIETGIDAATTLGDHKAADELADLQGLLNRHD
ncbi:MAG: tetratricopeptide repeat protein [Planctomycetes bacterium]|jgi:Tfp pilus assembly protein PilF|nr:tetratricopeptide repeat protein [Planctomycetota bacterium]